MKKTEGEERKESGREGKRGLKNQCVQPLLSLEQMETELCVCFVINESACQDNAGGMLICWNYIYVKHH